MSNWERIIKQKVEHYSATPPKNVWQKVLFAVQHPFEWKMRQKTANQESAPSPDLWASISTQIPHSAEQKIQEKAQNIEATPGKHVWKGIDKGLQDQAAFDQKIANRLQQVEGSVPEAVWGRILRHLSGRKMQQRRRRMAIAATLLLGAIIPSSGPWLNMGNPLQYADHASTQSDDLQKENFADEQQSDDATTASPSANERAYQRDDYPPSKAIDQNDDQNAGGATTYSPEESASSLASAEPSPSVTNDPNRNSTPIVGQDAPYIAAYSSARTQESSAELSAINTEAKGSDAKYTTDVPGGLWLSNNLLFSTSAMSLDLLGNALASKIPANKAAGYSSYVHFNRGLFVQEYQASEEQSSLASLNAQIDQEGSFTSLEMGFAFPVRPRWELSLGLGLTNASKSSFFSTVIKEPTYNATSSYKKVNYSNQNAMDGSQKNQKSENGYFDQSATQNITEGNAYELVSQFTWLDVPLLVAYNYPVLPDLSLNLQGGFVGRFLLTSQSYLPSLDQSMFIEIPATYAHDFYQSSLAGRLNLGLKYRFHPQFSVGLHYQYQRNLTSFASTDEYITTLPVQRGLGVGVFWTLH